MEGEAALPPGEPSLLPLFVGGARVPTYEYECDDCKRVYEVRQPISAAPLTACQHCGGRVRRLLSPAPFILKGGGWYVTDYPSASRKKAMEAEKKSSDSGGAEKKSSDSGGAEKKSSDSGGAEKKSSDSGGSAKTSDGAGSSSTSSTSTTASTSESSPAKS
jgi:putative FmdB family regulatory protein